MMYSYTSVLVLTADQPLNAGSGVPAIPVPTLGRRLLLTVREDGTGGHKLTGTDANFVGINLEIDPSANAATVYGLDAILNSNNNAVWFQTTPQRMGVTL